MPVLEISVFCKRTVYVKVFFRKGNLKDVQTSARIRYINNKTERNTQATTSAKITSAIPYMSRNHWRKVNAAMPVSKTALSPAMV